MGTLLIFNLYKYSKPIRINSSGDVAQNACPEHRSPRSTFSHIKPGLMIQDYEANILEAKAKGSIGNSKSFMVI